MTPLCVEWKPGSHCRLLAPSDEIMKTECMVPLGFPVQVSAGRDGWLAMQSQAVLTNPLSLISEGKSGKRPSTDQCAKSSKHEAHLER